MTLHPSTRTETAVEVHNQAGQLIATIHATHRGLCIISRYLQNRPDLLLIEPSEPAALHVNLIADTRDNGTGETPHRLAG